MDTTFQAGSRVWVAWKGHWHIVTIKKMVGDDSAAVRLNLRLRTVALDELVPCDDKYEGMKVSIGIDPKDRPEDNSPHNAVIIHPCNPQGTHFLVYYAFQSPDSAKPIPRANLRGIPEQS
jgi:hypothetical protein